MCAAVPFGRPRLRGALDSSFEATHYAKERWKEGRKESVVSAEEERTKRIERIKERNELPLLRTRMKERANNGTGPRVHLPWQKIVCSM